MTTLDLYEYPGALALTPSAKALPQCLERRLWIFQIRCDQIPGIAVTLRAVQWQTRATSRHKWTNDRAWYQFMNDCHNPRMMPSDYFVRERPEIPAVFVKSVLDIVRESVWFESENKR